MGNNKINSCIMLAANLETPVSLSSIFDSGDLSGDGVIYDTHVTLLFAPDQEIYKTDILPQVDKAIQDNIPGYSSFNDVVQEHCSTETTIPVYDLFDLGNFENDDSGYVVLKMKKSLDNIWPKVCTEINKGLSKEYSVRSSFGSYTPHLTIAEVKPGKSSKYLGLESLKLILRDSIIQFEDIIVSYSTNEPGKYDKYNVTNYYAVPRYFRERDLEREIKEQ